MILDKAFNIFVNIWIFHEILTHTDTKYSDIVLFVLMIYIPVNIFSVCSGCFRDVFLPSWVEMIKNLAQGHNTVPPVSN